MKDSPQRIAVVGCGVAGLTAAWLLSRRHEVHLFERNAYVGGHTRTISVKEKTGKFLPVDTGFIVMNHRNYPLFTRILEQLKVPLAESCMSFSYYDERSGYGYAGHSIRSLFPRFSIIFKAHHWAMIRDIHRFARLGFKDLSSGYLSGKTLGTYLEERNFGRPFRENYLYPMGAAIWSSPLNQIENFPGEPYLHFLENHGLLRLGNRPQWHYIPGGGKTYVESLLKDLKNMPRVNAAPRSIGRVPGGIIIHTAEDRYERFDHVVIGTHADEALALLNDPCSAERRLLGAWRYQKNEVVLHTYTPALPRDRRIWASWNFIREENTRDGDPVSVSYYMNRLQNLSTTTDYIVSLNRQNPIPEEQVVDHTTLTHPQYDFASLVTQPQLADRNGLRNTWFCGSYFGYGFHEDAVRSAVNVANAFGIEL